MCSIQLDHLFAAVVWIANQSLPGGIDDKVQILQRNLTNQYRTVIWDFGHTHATFATLDS